MLCPNCGCDNSEDARVCCTCANRIASPAWISVDTSTEPESQAATDSKALASLGLGLLSIFPPAGIASIIFGHASLGAIRRSNGELRGTNVAKLGLICGYAGLLLFCLGFFGAIRYLHIPLRSFFSTPPALAAPPPAKVTETVQAGPAVEEVQVMGALLQVTVAQTVHFHSNPNVGYACTMSELKSSGLNEDVATWAAQNGYNLSIEKCTRTRDGRVVEYLALAKPRDGQSAHIFCANQVSGIRIAQDDDVANCPVTGLPAK